MQTISNNSQGVSDAKFPPQAHPERKHLSLEDVDKNITVESLEDTEVRLKKKTTIEPVPSKLGVASSKKTSSLMYNIRQNVRNDFTSNLLGRKKSSTSIHSVKRKDSSKSRISH